MICFPPMILKDIGVGFDFTCFNVVRMQRKKMYNNPDVSLNFSNKLKMTGLVCRSFFFVLFFFPPLQIRKTTWVLFLYKMASEEVECQLNGTPYWNLSIADICILTKGKAMQWYNSQNLLCWKGSTKIKSNSGVHTETPKFQTLCLRTVAKCSMNSSSLGPQLLLIHLVLQTLHHLHSLPLDNSFISLLSYGTHSCTQCRSWGLVAALGLMYARVWLALRLPRHTGDSQSTCYQPESTDSFLQCCCPASHPSSSYIYLWLPHPRYRIQHCSC